jgi:hypothetical protein
MFPNIHAVYATNGSPLLTDVVSSNPSGGPVLGFQLSYWIASVKFNDAARGVKNAVRALSVKVIFTYITDIYMNTNPYTMLKHNMQSLYINRDTFRRTSTLLSGRNHI